MCIWCHETATAVESVKREYTAINSLTVGGGGIASLACEHALRSLWYHSTGETFPHEKILPHHKTGNHIKKIGIDNYLSKKSQIFILKMDGYAFEEAQYPNTQAYKDHTKPISSGRAKDILNGIEVFLNDIKEMTNNPEVRSKIIEFKNKL